MDEYQAPTWFYNLNERNAFDLADEEPAKKEWVIQKLPIKGGSVLRSAMQIDMYYQPVSWVQIEGIVIV